MRPANSSPAVGRLAEPLPPGVGVAIVVSRYNEEVTGRLLAGALETLVAGGVPRERIEVAWVPGAFELPFIADVIAARGGCAAVLCLGAVIRGETTHDQHIARAVAGGIEAVARSRGLPVLFGVLTCDTLAQALERAGVPAAEAGPGPASAGRAEPGRAEADRAPSNKGAECAVAALEMITLVRRLRAGAAGG